MILRFILRLFFFISIALGALSLVALQQHVETRDAIEALIWSCVFAAFFGTALDEEERDEW